MPNALKKSKKVDKIYCFPGNAGTSKYSKKYKLDIKIFEKLKNFIINKKIELVIIGPEKPLVNGVVDYLEKFKLKFLVQIKLHLN